MVVIFGLGFTGSRIGRRLLARSVPVISPVRGVVRFADLAEAGVQIRELNLNEPEAMELPHHAAVVNTIPPLPEAENTKLREAILHITPSRLIYVSSTGVYGDQVDVNAETPATPTDERGRARLEEERWVTSGPWSSLILRAAAIYGPNRGVHAAVREGKTPRGSGTGVVSRIHVDDLAAMIEAAIFTGVEGAWPVADETPAATAEIVSWCREFLQMEMLPAGENTPVTVTAGRRIDGRGIREILGIDLKYPSWRTGIPASIAEENELRK